MCVRTGFVLWGRRADLRKRNQAAQLVAYSWLGPLGLALVRNTGQACACDDGDGGGM